MRLHAFAKTYVAFARIAAKDARQERGELYGRMAFFVIILGVFSSLWRATREAGLTFGDPGTLVWYLASTEWIGLSAPMVHVDVQEAVRRGDVACALGRPVSFAGAAFAESLGQLATRAPLLGATAIACGWAFTGWMPPAAALVRVAVFGLIASALLTASYLAIGLLAFWLEDVTPVFWIWQKLLFVLGGLMLPIAVYPVAVQRLAVFTPFPALLAEPASFATGGQALAPVIVAIHLLVWGAVLAVAIRWLFARATTRMTFNGG